MASKDSGIATRTIRGMFWVYGSYIASKFLVLLSVAILARLLSPVDFGLVAFALVFTVLLDAISDLGVSQALIIADDEEVYDKANTAWTVGVAVGALLMLITAALGPVAAAFFDEPALVVMLPVLGFNLLIRSVGVTHQALVQKQLDFRKRTLAQMADVVVRGCVGIGLALAGAGAYSLVGGYLAGSAALVGTLWAVVHWRPRPRIDRSHLSGLLRFGGGLTVLGIISVFVVNVDYVVIGKVLGAEDLGLYTLGWRLPELLIVNLSVVAGVVLFPSFATIGRAALDSAYLTALRYVLMVSLPMAVGLFVLAEPFVLTVFGSQWVDSIAVMQVLTVFAFAEAVGIPGGIVYKSIGRVDVLIKIAIPQAVLAIGSILIFVDQGIVAVAACQAGAATVGAILSTTVATRLLKTGWRGNWEAAWPSLCAGAVLGAAVFAVTELLEDPYLTLAVGVPIGAVAYLGSLWLIVPEDLIRLWRTATGRRADAAEPA